MTGAQVDTEPDPLVMAAVVELARRLDGDAAADSADSAATVLAPVPERHTELNKLDQAIIKDLGALSKVCRRPHDRLGVEHVLVRAGEARRVPVEGLVRLASRTEDWEGLDLFGNVIPKQLLTIRYTEEFDFFENRMAAQLIDRLRRYLAERARDLDTLERHVAGLGRYERALHVPQSHWKRHRLAMILGKAASKSVGRSAAIATAADQLRKLHGSVNLLRATDLYRQVNRRAMIPFRLPRTNLLLSDHYYLRTARLWEAWALRESNESADLREVRGAFAEAYTGYVAAVVVRALKVLGLKPSTQGDTDARVATLEGPNGRRWTLETSDSGVIELRSEDTVIARVIAAAADFTADSTRIPGVVPDDIAQSEAPTIIAYPGLRAAREQLPPAARRLVHRTGPRPPDRSLSSVVPVSPVEIESTERLARALRWPWWAAFLLKSYPQRVECPSWWQPDSASWFVSERRGLLILRPPTDAELAAIESGLNAAYRQPTRRRTGADTVTPTTVAAAIRRAGMVLSELGTCPMGRCRVPIQFESRNLDTFHCRCSDCKGQWGIRTCHKCKSRFPVLWANGTKVVDADHGDAVDEAFGSDITALPCPESSDWSQFRCPRCGTCQDTPRCGCADR